MPIEVSISHSDVTPGAQKPKNIVRSLPAHLMFALTYHPIVKRMKKLQRRSTNGARRRRS